MNVIIGFCFQLAVALSTASADPVTIPLAKTDAGELMAVLPSESVLSLMLIANLAHLLVFFGKTVWEMFRKDKVKMEEKVDALAQAVQELKGEIRTLSKLPDEAEILDRIEQRTEWLVFKAMRDLGLNKVKRD